MTGFKKFEHFEQASDPEVSSQDVDNELHRRYPFSQHLNSLKKCCEKGETALKKWGSNFAIKNRRFCLF